VKEVQSEGTVQVAGCASGPASADVAPGVPVVPVVLVELHAAAIDTTTTVSTLTMTRPVLDMGALLATSRPRPVPLKR
jgi:hypothetical protein